MSTLKEMTPAKLKAIRTKLASALESVEDEFGLKMKIGNFSYGENNFDVKLSGKITNGKTDMELQRDEWSENCYYLGLKSNDFYKKVVDGGKTFRLIGISLRSRKYPLIAVEVSTGKEFKLSAHLAR